LIAEENLSKKRAEDQGDGAAAAADILPQPQDQQGVMVISYNVL
jgi:hypothetical protein